MSIAGPLARAERTQLWGVPRNEAGAAAMWGCLSHGSLDGLPAASATRGLIVSQPHGSPQAQPSVSGPA